MQKKMTTGRYAMMAMMIAIYIILSMLVIQVGGLKITLEHFPVILCAVLYGPCEAMLVGGIGEFINQMTSFGFTPTTLLWILPIVFRGFFMGTCCRMFKERMKLTALLEKKPPVMFAVICIFSGLCSSLLNTFALYVDSNMFGYYSFALVFGALTVRLILSTITSVVIVIAIKPILHALYHARLI